MAGKGGTVERRMAWIASRAHGVTSRTELLGAGITKAEIDHRIQVGALIPQHRGVYRVGHRAPSLEATYMAAVKACGDGAVLSGLAAAHLLGLVKRRPARPEVTAPTARRVAGVRNRRSRHIEPITVNRIRVTSVPSTLIDIAAVLSEEALARACHEAGVRYATTPAHVEAALGRRPNAPGARKLRRVMNGDVHVSLSVLERRFLALVRRAGLPLPDQVNRRVGEHRVDCRWATRRLTVELDSYRFHNSRWSWQRDRDRERAAHARGDQHRRYTWHDVAEDPRFMLAELSRLLAA